MTPRAMAAEPTEKNEAQDKAARDAEFLEEARERFKLAEQAESLIRERGLDDLKMRAGDQWDSDMKAKRLKQKRPCLTVNRLPQFVRQVSNDQRQNRPAIQVSPVDDKGDPKTAEVLQGLIRHIEYDSGADAAYDTAFNGAANTGLGYFRVITEYADPMSFDLDIKIKRIRNQFSVYIDPDAKEADRSDMRWAFIVDDFSEEEFEARHPDAEVCKDKSTWETARQVAPSWMEGKQVRVAEYFCMTTTKATLLMLADGTVLLEDQLKRALEINPEAVPPVVLKQRDTEIPAVRWCKIIGTEILEDTLWPGRWIPIFPVLGDELEVDGQVILEGVIRHAKDQQRMLNVFVSTETEAIGLTPKAPWIVAEGQLENREKEWKASNSETQAFLTYKPTSLNGQPVPPPQRNFAEANTQAITNARLLVQDDMKALVGIFDSALGQHSNETSGIAIRARQNQSGTANYHLVDNLTRTIRHLGRVLVDLIPKVYDAPRVARIIGEDGTEKTVWLNQKFKDPNTGEELLYDLSIGKYDVRVTAGPSYATKRQEAAASMMQLAQADPTLNQKAGDLIVKNMDWPGAQEIADRLKKFLPPQAQDEDKGGGQIPPQVQAQMQQIKGAMDQQSQLIDQLTKALEDAQEKLDSKALEIASKERIAAMQTQADLLKTWATLDQKDSALAMQAELEQIQQALARLAQPALQPSALDDQDTPAEPPMAGGMPMAQGMDTATGGGIAPGTPEPGRMPGVMPQGPPAAPAPGSPMETP